VVDLRQEKARYGSCKQDHQHRQDLECAIEELEVLIHLLMKSLPIAESVGWSFGFLLTEESRHGSPREVGVEDQKEGPYQEELDGGIPKPPIGDEPEAKLADLVEPVVGFHEITLSEV
jgi:hypothetical protein